MLEDASGVEIIDDVTDVDRDQADADATDADANADSDSGADDTGASPSADAARGRRSASPAHPLVGLRAKEKKRRTRARRARVAPPPPERRVQFLAVPSLDPRASYRDPVAEALIRGCSPRTGLPLTRGSDALECPFDIRREQRWAHPRRQGGKATRHSLRRGDTLPEPAPETDVCPAATSDQPQRQAYDPMATELLQTAPPPAAAQPTVQPPIARPVRGPEDPGRAAPTAHADCTPVHRPHRAALKAPVQRPHSLRHQAPELGSARSVAPHRSPHTPKQDAHWLLRALADMPPWECLLCIAAVLLGCLVVAFAIRAVRASRRYRFVGAGKPW
jgi:hypothetical protein